MTALLATSAVADVGPLGLFEVEAGSDFLNAGWAISPHPPSKIAENVTVITAEEIERLNAHTLADALKTVPGIQFPFERTPGTVAGFFSLHGALSTTILLYVDGVRQNDFGLNGPHPELIPVQSIERVEIVKGPSSSAWGPGVGGAINVITKAPDTEHPIGGVISGSIGKRATADGRLETTGTMGDLGYYLAGGNLRSDGLLPNNGTDLNHAFAKLSLARVVGGTLTGAFSVVNAQGGYDEGTVGGMPVHDDFYNRTTSGYLTYTRSVGERARIDLQGFALGREEQSRWNDRIGGQNIASPSFPWSQNLDADRGAKGRYTWGDARNNLVAGGEYDRASLKNRFINPVFIPLNERVWERWATYLNATASLGPVTLLPGARYDKTGLGENAWSWTLGATWQVTEKTLLRGYGARGYGLPDPQSEGGLMRVHTMQGGVETSDLPGLWLKGSYFFKRLKDVEGPALDSVTNQEIQGVEIEARTSPLHGIALTGGYTFTYGRDTNTHERLKTGSNGDFPSQVVKIGLLYDRDDLGLRGTVTGGYVSWNAEAGQLNRSGGIVWDAHADWKIKPISETSPELFASWRNILSAQQTGNFELYDNARGWFEGGARCRF